MRKKLYTALIMLLGAFASGSAVYAADSCPTDSVIGYGEDGTIISKILYQYDDAGHTIQEETWKINSDSVLNGQSKTTTDYYSDGKVKETASWEWSKETNDWQGVKKYQYSYNEFGTMILSAIYSWSSSIHSWVNDSKTEYEYNKSNLLVLSVTYVGEESEWIPQTKQEIDYDDDDNLILNRYWSAYNKDTESWIGAFWKAWEYKSSTSPSNPSNYEEYIWKDDNWSGNTKYEVEYDSKGRILFKRIYSDYDYITNLWQNNTEYYYNFDQWGNTILSELYIWNVDYWRGLSKEEYEYNSNKKQIGKATYAWDDTNRQWIGVSKSKTLYDENENLILDEQYTWSGNDWAGSKKEEYIYDNNKLILSTIAYKWDVVNKKWDNNTKVLADYNANKMQILDERYQWTIDAELAEGGYWKGTKKDSTVYNAKNVETESFSYQWDDENRRWLGNTKYRKEFDAANNLVLEEQYNWQKVDSMAEGGFWKGIKKEEYAYNAAKQQTLAIIYAWSDAIENWIGDTKKISNYDSNKNQILNEQYTWVKVDSMASGGYWQGTEKATYTFNKNKQQTSSWVYAWNDADTAWVYATRDTASYDSKKNQTLDERYTWDAENGKWVGTLKKEYAYNTSGQQIMFAYYTWDADNAKWIGTQKEEDEQDDEGRTIMKATYTWATDDWQGKTKDTYTYFRNDTVAEHVTYTWQTNKWVEKSKTEDSYSADGQHTATATYTWKNGAWAGSKMTAWAYTESGKILIQEDYTWGTDNWVKSTRLENIYTNDQLTAYTTFKWDGAAWVNVKHWEQVDANTERTYEWYNNTWSKTQEKTKTYADGLLTQELNQNWSKGVQTAGSKTEYTYTGGKLTQKSSYVYDSGTSQWVETSRERMEFDTNGHQTLSIQETYKGGVTISGTMTENTYDADGNLTNTTQSTCTNDVWSYVSKTDNEYNGKTTITTNYTSPNGTTWQGVDKQEKEYGEGKDVTITQYEWSTLLTNWVGTSKTGYTYYPNGKEKSVIDYRWTGSDWVADTKTEYEYSGSKNIVTATYSWETDAWVGQSKIGYYYNEGEDQTTATWDWKDGKWVGNTKMGETFDQFGNRTGQTTYMWNGTDFVYKQKTQTEYGISSKDKTTATYTWNTTNQSWQGVSKSGVTYNGSKISSQTEYKWISGFDWEYTKKTEYEYGTNANDKTTATYVWDASIPDWVGQSKSGVTYASNGKIASQFSYTWGGTDWIGVSKTEYEYGSGKNNSVAQYVWGDSTWIGKSKVTENFTDQGDSLSVYTYCWKNDDWSDSLKTEHSYDDHGNDTLCLRSQWIDDAWSILITSTKWEIQYDELDNVILDAHYKINKKNQWVGTGYKYVYQYDQYGNKIYSERMKWSATKWIGESKNEWSYNSEGLLLRVCNWTWDSNKKKYKGLLFEEYGYYNDTIQNMNAVYSFNVNDKIWNWEGISKFETIYDDAGNQVALIQYTWSTELWNWIGLFKYEDTYDEKDRLIEHVTSRYTDEWNYDTKTTYSFDSSGRQVATNSYLWNNAWVPRSADVYSYDCDNNSKLRSHLDALWNVDGSIQKYEYIYYYYACDPKYQITVEASPADGGSVSGEGEYILNGKATITATPEPGCYTFEKWDDGDTNATRHITVTEDKTYTAIFKPIEHTIKASVTGGKGSVTVTFK